MLKKTRSQVLNSNTTKTFHVYLDERCLFKNLNQQEFDIIWGRLYHSYWDGLTYSEVETDEAELQDASY